MTTSTIRTITGAVALLALVIVAACGPSAPPGATNAPQSNATMTLTPSSGPDGTETEVRIRDAEPNNDITVTYGAGTATGRTDSVGALDLTITVNGPDGSDVTVDARGGPNLTDVASAVFRVTAPVASTLPPTTTSSTTTSSIPDPTPPPPVVTVSVSPAMGKSGTNATITVTGPPDSPVTLNIRGAQAQTGSSTDANGNWTFETTFNGADDEAIQIEATVGVGADTGTATTEFVIKPALNISFEYFEAEQFHETAALSPQLQAANAFSAIFLTLIAAFDAATDDGLAGWSALSIADENRSGTVDAGDVVQIEPQAFADGRVEIGIDRGGPQFIGLVPPDVDGIDQLAGTPLSDPQQGPDGWVLDPSLDMPIFILTGSADSDVPVFVDVDFGDPALIPVP